MGIFSFLNLLFQVIIQLPNLYKMVEQIRANARAGALAKEEKEREDAANKNAAAMHKAQEAGDEAGQIDALKHAVGDYNS